MSNYVSILSFSDNRYHINKPIQMELDIRCRYNCYTPTWEEFVTIRILSHNKIKYTGRAMKVPA